MRPGKIITAFIFSFIFYTGVTAQSPELLVDGKTNNGVSLQKLHVEIKVCGNIARTTWQMVFKNNTNRILEGTLNFPLKEGISVSRYALDINGKMREAVPVDRGKGTEVFEAIERKRVDPGLLEKVEGNIFRTRIYPINANSTRTVLIGYEEQLSLAGDNAYRYFLPMNGKDTIAHFKVDITVMSAGLSPVFEQTNDMAAGFSKTNNEYTATIEKQYSVPGKQIAFSVPAPAEGLEIKVQEFENKYYYIINTTIKNEVKEKTYPKRIALLWDVSLSSNNRDHKKETALLDAYFHKISNASVTLIQFGNNIYQSKTYQLLNGNWDALKKDAENIVYDGGTDLGCINTAVLQADEFILLGDGRQTFGEQMPVIGNKPVHCISSTASFDLSNLQFIAVKSAGQFINLQQTPVEEAVTKLTTEPLRFLGIKQNSSIKENYPSLPVTVDGNFSVAAIAAEEVQEIELQFGYGNKVSFTKLIAVDAGQDACSNFDITKIFAQKKIAELDIQYEKNKKEIESLGKSFGIVTRNTSLIVLETLEDYIRYDIEPPAELMEQYSNVMKQRRQVTQQNKENNLVKSVDMLQALKKWWDHDPGNKIEGQKKQLPPPPTTNQSVTQNNRQRNNNSLQPRPTGNTYTTTGKVIDKDGSPVPFASIKIKGTRMGTNANMDGNYTINIKKGDVLEYSATGFKHVELRAGTANYTVVTLEQSANQLTEVVVTGLSGVSRERRDMAGSVSSINSPAYSVGEGYSTAASALEGRVAGVQITTGTTAALGRETVVRLRGDNSFGATASPVTVVDGVIRPAGGYDFGEIENVTVIQPAAASALYGSEGASGAIVITTKKNGSNVLADTITSNRVRRAVDSAKILLQAAEEMDYLPEIRKAAKQDRYSKYLELRKQFASIPSYYFQVGAYFIRSGDKETGIKILTNLAEIEAGNYELYKMLGYKLKEAGEYHGELYAFKKVKELRPNDPQSYRDLALAYEDAGVYQAAVDMLYEGMTKSYSAEMSRMYAGIEEIFLMEINRLCVKYKFKIKLKDISKELLQPLPVDMRIVMNWNKNNTDIDLWVTDPDNEKCYYQHKTTAAGGRISDDFTEGFGPEQFILKKATKGKYRIDINYYSDRQTTISGPTTIMAEIYLHYGMPNEEKRIITLQMEKGRTGAVYVGEIEF